MCLSLHHFRSHFLMRRCSRKRSVLLYLVAVATLCRTMQSTAIKCPSKFLDLELFYEVPRYAVCARCILSAEREPSENVPDY